MPVIRKVIPFGERRRVRVLLVEKVRKSVIVTSEDINYHGLKEGYICVYRKGTVKAHVGQIATLVFTQGGPNGGYWAHHPEEGG